MARLQFALLSIVSLLALTAVAAPDGSPAAPKPAFQADAIAPATVAAVPTPIGDSDNQLHLNIQADLKKRQASSNATVTSPGGTQTDASSSAASTSSGGAGLSGLPASSSALSQSVESTFVSTSTRSMMAASTISTVVTVASEASTASSAAGAATQTGNALIAAVGGIIGLMVL